MPRSLYPRERPGTHYIGGLVGPRAGLHVCGKYHFHRDSIPGPSFLNELLYRLCYPGPGDNFWEEKYPAYTLNRTPYVPAHSLLKLKYGKQLNSPVFEKTGQGGDVWVCSPIALDAIGQLFKQCWVHALSVMYADTNTLILTSGAGSQVTRHLPNCVLRSGVAATDDLVVGSASM
jgi:hypothetical protein